MNIYRPLEALLILLAKLFDNFHRFQVSGVRFQYLHLLSLTPDT
jgi:hypothetical protein